MVVWFYRHICIDIIIHSNMTNDSNDHGPFMLLIFLTSWFVDVGNWDTKKRTRDFLKNSGGFQWIERTCQMSIRTAPPLRVWPIDFPTTEYTMWDPRDRWRWVAQRSSEPFGWWILLVFRNQHEKTHKKLASNYSIKLWFSTKPMETSIKLAFARMMFNENSGSL